MVNAWANKNAEIARLKNELADERLKPTLQEFAHRLCNSIGTLLAMKRYEDWPEVAKTAFEHEQRNSPTSAQLYRDRLPK